MRRQTVLSVEQALALPYATLRFVHLGWRVIRVEAMDPSRSLPGDPNRYVGSEVAGGDRRSYFIAPNVGKEAIALNLKSEKGRELLRRLIRELGVDIFCCNTLPSRYAQLGIDYEGLRAGKPDLIWAGISALGPDYPDTPGYDPAIQAMGGIMELTGVSDGPPTLAGVPMVDLKAGDELFASVCLALAERAETGAGREIHVSMLQAAASWLITTLPLLDFGCDDSEVTRFGNEHRKFIPTNVYPTREGFIYMAIGSDAQWERLTGVPGFSALASGTRASNAGRMEERREIHREIAAITAGLDAAELSDRLSKAVIPHASIHTVEQVRELAALRDRLTRTTTPEGRKVRMQPMATDVEQAPLDFSFPASYGFHTGAVLREAGLAEVELVRLREERIISA